MRRRTDSLALAAALLGVAYVLSVVGRHDVGSPGPTTTVESLPGPESGAESPPGYKTGQGPTTTDGGVSATREGAVADGIATQAGNAGVGLSSTPPPPLADRIVAETGNRAKATWYETAPLTTAHRTLPFGAKVRVCLVRCVVVIVADRGPEAWTGRDFDLSADAFAYLAPLSTGVIEITWSVVA